MSQLDLLKLQTQLTRLRLGGFIIGGLGLLLCVAGAFFSLEQFWQSYLLAYIFWLEIPLGCLAIVMLHHLVGGRWGLLIRRFLETGAMTLPLMALLFVPLLFGLSQLYSWTDSETVAGSALLQHKSVYLNVPFFLGRTVLYFVVWIAIAYFLSRWSLEQDRTAQPALTIRLRRLSAFGLILYVLTATFAAYDWLMSLEPEWFSSIYGLLFIVGQALATLAFVVIVLMLPPNRQALARVMSGSAWANQLNDLGNLMLGFVMIWAYISFSQFLIIWSANIPEEAVWYYHRSQGGWQWVGLALILFHFALPFLLLLSRRAKRQAQLLTGLAVFMICMRLVDLFWLVAPAFHQTGLHLHWLDLAAPIAIGGIWLAVFAWLLAGKPLLPLHDPALQEILHHE